MECRQLSLNPPNPFADPDENEAQLEDLVEQLHLVNGMTTSEYAEANNEVATCTTFKSSENWRQELWEKVVYQMVINSRGLMLKMRIRMLMKSD